jgi:hypothetical protein
MDIDRHSPGADEGPAERSERRPAYVWIERQLERVFGPKATPVIRYFAACRSYSRLLAAQERAIRANAELALYNSYLERERDWLQSRNAQLRVDRAAIIGAPALNSKLKIAPGMLSQMDMAAIVELAKKVPDGGTLVDVGSLLGMSASLWCIHSSAARIVCVDPWKYEPWLKSFNDANGPITMESFLANVPDVRIETIQGYSPACAVGWSAPIDLYWEDGDHHNPGCADSIRFWSAHVKPGGIASGHDYHMPDVKAEAEALAAKWGSTVELLGSVWWVRRGNA